MIIVQCTRNTSVYADLVIKQGHTCCTEGKTDGVAGSGAEVFLPVEPTELEFSPSPFPAVSCAGEDTVVSPPNSPDQAAGLVQFD